MTAQQYSLSLFVRCPMPVYTSSLLCSSIAPCKKPRLMAACSDLCQEHASQCTWRCELGLLPDAPCQAEPISHLAAERPEQ